MDKVPFHYLDYPELITGVYMDAHDRKWFCLRDHWIASMGCSSSGQLFVRANLKTFKMWGWKLTEDQTY